VAVRVCAARQSSETGHDGERKEKRMEGGRSKFPSVRLSPPQKKKFEIKKYIHTKVNYLCHWKKQRSRKTEEKRLTR
jgi:hypothetical protein